MLGSSIRALVAHITIQKWAPEAPNRLACAPREVRAHLDHACIRRACFVVWTSSGRPLQPSKHGTSAMRPPEDSKLLLLPSYGGCDVFVYNMYNKLM